MTSRETSEDFMPSWPMAMPSVTVMVVNSRGVPPASQSDRGGRAHSPDIIHAWRTKVGSRCVIPLLGSGAGTGGGNVQDDRGRHRRVEDR